MEGISPETFKLNHLRKRIAQLTVQYEDAAADTAVTVQVLTQQRDELQAALQTQTLEVANRDAEIAELKEQLASFNEDEKADGAEEPPEDLETQEN